MTRPIVCLVLALLAALCTACRPAAAQTSYNFSVLHTFNGSDGSTPLGMVNGNNGCVYGITNWGGPLGSGVFYKIDSSGNFSVLHAFGPEAGSGPQFVTLASDGHFYVTTYPGYDPTTGAPTTSAAIFRLDSQGNCNLIHSFNNAVDGNEATFALIDGHDGYLYSITQYGGTYNDGTFFRIDSSGNVLVLYAFNADALPVLDSLMLADNGLFYGFGEDDAGNDIVFTLDRSGVDTPLNLFPSQDVPFTNDFIDGGNGLFYGLIGQTGPNGFGGIASMDTSGNLTTLYNFTVNDGDVDNAYNLANQLLVGADGALYGQTGNQDIIGQEGVVFRITAGGQYSILHSFDATNPGVIAGSSLVQTPSGALIGNIDGAIQNTSDYVFALTPSSGPTPPTSPAVIASISPQTIVADQGDFTLTVTGSGFPALPDLLINNQTVPATLNCDGTVTATIPAADAVTSGNYAIRVVDSTTGLQSAAALFTVAEPAPVVYDWSPATVQVGNEPASITVWGDGLLPNTYVEGPYVNGETDGPSTTINPDGSMTVALPPDMAPLFAVPGVLTFYVVNSAEFGGGVSEFSINVLAPSLNTFPAGLNMVSFPGTYPTTSVDNLFGYGGSILASWDTTAFSYSMTTSGAPGSLQPGVGYWVRFPQQVNITTPATPPTGTGPFTIPLLQGWNMIGDPFDVEESTGAMSLLTNSFTSVSLTEAQAAGNFVSLLWAYSSGTGQYYEASSVSPYAGYWIYAYQPCQLLVTPPPVAP